MPSLPTEPLAAAQFLIRHLYRPVDLGGNAPLYALAETANPCQGDIWFWSDDNAKALELLSRSELWQRAPRAVDVRARPRVTAIDEEGSRPDVDGELVSGGEVVIETEEQELLDLGLAIHCRRRIVGVSDVASMRF